MLSKPILVTVMAYLMAFAMAAPTSLSSRSPQLIPSGGSFSNDTPFSPQDLERIGGPPVLITPSLKSVSPNGQDLPRCSDVSKITFSGPAGMVIPIRCIAEPSDKPQSGKVDISLPPPPLCSSLKKVGVTIPPDSDMAGTKVSVQCVSDAAPGSLASREEVPTVPIGPVLTEVNLAETAPALNDAETAADVAAELVQDLHDLLDLVTSRPALSEAEAAAEVATELPQDLQDLQDLLDLLTKSHLGRDRSSLE